MTSVKAEYPREEWHAPLLMGVLLREVSGVFADEEWDGLRQSHFRVITSVPAEGISVTELGERVGMSKQGCGQFVTALVESGHLRVAADPRDKRVRLVRRTAKGNRTIAAVTQRMLTIEDEWADRVGRRRLLEELAQPTG
jgi:DNA-binding MarR family transcriptional regulator